MLLLAGRAAWLGNTFPNHDVASSATNLGMEDSPVTQTQHYVLGAALRHTRSGAIEMPSA